MMLPMPVQLYSTLCTDVCNARRLSIQGFGGWQPEKEAASSLMPQWEAGRCTHQTPSLTWKGKWNVPVVGCKVCPTVLWKNTRLQPRMSYVLVRAADESHTVAASHQRWVRGVEAGWRD